MNPLSGKIWCKSYFLLSSQQVYITKDVIGEKFIASQTCMPFPWEQIINFSSRTTKHNSVQCTIKYISPIYIFQKEKGNKREGEKVEKKTMDKT
jgi:hypothetical protein